MSAPRARRSAAKLPARARWLVVLTGGSCLWTGLDAQGHLSTGRGAVHSIDGKALERVWVEQLIDPSETVNGMIVVLEPETAAALKLRSCGQHGRVLPVLEPFRVHGVHLQQLRDAEYAGYSGTYEYGGAQARF